MVALFESMKNNLPSNLMGSNKNTHLECQQKLDSFVVSLPNDQKNKIKRKKKKKKVTKIIYEN